MQFYPLFKDSRTSLTNNLTQPTIPTLVLDLEYCYLTTIAIKVNLTELLHLLALIVPIWPLVLSPQFVCVVHIVHGAPAHWLPPPLARIGQLPKARLANQGKQGIELKLSGRWTLNTMT